MFIRVSHKLPLVSVWINEKPSTVGALYYQALRSDERVKGSLELKKKKLNKIFGFKDKTIKLIPT